MTDLVFDIGATRARFALAEKGRLGDVYHTDTDASAGGFARLLGGMQDLVGNKEIRAVAGGMPVQLEGEEGRIMMASNLPSWVGLPVIERLKSNFRSDVYINNDVVMGGLGEYNHGIGPDSGVMAYFTVSTGVNAVRLIDGHVDETVDRFEIGQQVVAGLDGKLQTLESLVGGAAFEKRRGRLPKQVRDKAVWAVEARNLALGVYNTMLYWNPEIIVFNGSMMKDVSLKNLRAELEEMPVVLPIPRLEYSKLGDVAGLYGAMEWLRQKVG
jgi:glucokinase